MLKASESFLPNLDLSQIVIDNTVPPTPRGDGIVNDETIDSICTVEQEVKDTDGVVIAQPTLDGPNVVVVSSTKNPTTTKGLLAVNPAVLNAPYPNFSLFCV